MEQNQTLESLLSDMLSPIITKAVENAIAKHFTVTPEPHPVGTGYLTITEAAEFLKVAKPTVYGYVHNQKISHYKAGNRLYFKQDDLNAYITQHRRKSLDEIHKDAEEHLIRIGRKRLR